MMIRSCLLIAVFAFCACGTEDSQTEDPEQYTIEQFYENTNVWGGWFSPDASKILVSSNETGIYNAVALPVDGSEPQQLTHSEDESIFAITYFPEDERILYVADEGGNEITHIFLRQIDGTVTDLTPVSTAKSQFFGWAHDLESFFYTSNQRDPDFFDLYEMEIDSFTSGMVYRNTEGLDVSAISEDERYLVLSKTHTTHNQDLYLYDRLRDTTTHLTPHEGDVQYEPQFFSSDNSRLYYLTNEDREFMHLRAMLLDGSSSEIIFAVNWDVWYAYQSHADKYRVIGYNEDGKTVVQVFDVQTGEEIAFPDIEDRSISAVSISRDEQHMRLTASNSKFPGDIYVYHFETGDYKRLTNNLNPEIDPDDLVTAGVVRFDSYDGLSIPAIFYKPQQASADHPVPAMVWVHGGPGGQTRQSYFALIQYMVNHGYAILAVNNRGSSGYGKTFFKLDDRKHGEDDLQDCVYGKKYLQSLDYIDGERIGIIGGSYGGYMVMAALTFTPEEFDVGVNIFGVTNWLRTLKSIPSWWTSFRDALYAELGNPYSADSVRLRRISPLFHAGQVTKPLMVLQGANDPRVLQVESDEIVAAVRENGVPVEYVLFEDEGHGFRKKENEIEAYGKIVTFLDTYLKGEGPVAE